jgi:peroxiredoxin Q/BCP
MALKTGVLAPDFELADETGNLRRLSEFIGKPVVLYFYPKDDTPGCTTEACNFRDDYENYYAAGIIILGVSPDSTKSHTKFKVKNQLPFTLLADPEHLVCAAYGVWGKKKYMGKEYDGVFRTTFIIDSTGLIIRVYENVKPDGHSRQIMEALGLFHK